MFSSGGRGEWGAWAWGGVGGRGEWGAWAWGEWVVGGSGEHGRGGEWVFVTFIYSYTCGDINGSLLFTLVERIMSCIVLLHV